MSSIPTLANCTDEYWRGWEKLLTKAIFKNIFVGLAIAIGHKLEQGEGSVRYDGNKCKVFYFILHFQPYIDIQLSS